MAPTGTSSLASVAWKGPLFDGLSGLGRRGLLGRTKNMGMTQNEFQQSIKKAGVPDENVRVFTAEQLQIVYLLLDHQRISPEQIECLAYDLSIARDNNLFSNM
jgi:hypothetical protein